MGTRRGPGWLIATVAVVAAVCGVVMPAAADDPLVTTDDAALRAELQRLQTQDDGFRSVLDNVLLRLKALEDAPAPEPGDPGEPTDPTDPPPDPAGVDPQVGWNVSFIYQTPGLYTQKSDGSIEFDPWYVETMRPFRGRWLRVLNWIGPNKSGISTCEGMQGRKQSSRDNNSPVPLDVSIAAANELGVHLWITVPHLLSPAEQTKVAQRVEERLDPALRVRVEWSNETWNDKFGGASGDYLWGQYTYVREGAKSAKITPDAFHALKSIECWRSFEAVLGDARCDNVMATQSASASITRNRLAGDEVRAMVEVVAHAPYFKVLIDNYYTTIRDEKTGKITGYQLKPGVTMDSLFADVRQRTLGGGDSDVGRWSRGVRDAIAAAGLAGKVEQGWYEGGQHLVGTNKKRDVRDLFNRMQKDPRMGELYRDVKAACRAAGDTGALVMFDTFDDAWNGDNNFHHAIWRNGASLTWPKWLGATRADYSTEAARN